MRSGIDWDESIYSDADDCIIMEKSDDWIQYVLDKPMDTIPGLVFEYNSGVSVLLGKLVSIISGKRIDAWAEEVLFKPLGITEYYWKQTPRGEIDTEGGLYLSCCLLYTSGCYNKPEVRIGILEVLDIELNLTKLSVPYDDDGFMEEFEIRNVPARAFIKKNFVTRSQS